MLTWLLLASAPQSAGAIFRRPSRGGPSIHPWPPDTVVSLGRFFAAERQTLRLATCIPSALCFARPCDRLAPAKSTVARCRLCECGTADQRRAWRRRPPHRRATIRSLKPKTTVCWLRSLRPNTRIPLARLICPHCSTSIYLCLKRLQIDPRASKFSCLRFPSTRQSEANHRFTEIQDIYRYAHNIPLYTHKMYSVLLAALGFLVAATSADDSDNITTSAETDVPPDWATNDALQMNLSTPGGQPNPLQFTVIPLIPNAGTNQSSSSFVRLFPEVSVAVWPQC